MGLWSIIKEDFIQPKIQDPAFSSRIELFFNYPGVWAIVNYRFAHLLYQKKFKALARIISGISQFLTGVDLHPEAKIGRRVFLDHANGIVIGQTTIIEDDVLIYQGVTLGGTSLERGVKRHPTIKKGVIIGAGAKILGNITIGENAKIGSNAVVVKDVGAGLTAVGIPAYIIEHKKQEKSRAIDEFCENKLDKLENEILELKRKFKI
ncbi:serine O-acetyltransferase [Campylobacter cuniculorum]|uniref:Serine acetyltransferase n=2 Tax=Campylobacter cuniculorum TaxID=374106 RepID=A0A1W6BWR3_9BACT|nr:serine O-acetyltransferase [Campylobacter cuniculorum]ARJ56515.1 serine O-acetyltransferase [Campylobacter cuniculorum DSM 23162 = LMG 24588]QOR03999.1 serine O-acetyltransferase [Campylobacter cuniculorum]